MLLDGENDGPILEDGLTLGVTLPEGNDSAGSKPSFPMVAATFKRGCAPTKLLVRAKEKDHR